MDKIYDEVAVSSWNRWEDPGDYPNALAASPLPPGPWYPEATKGHALFRLTREEWKEVYDADADILAEIFELNNVTGDDCNYCVNKVAYERLGDYAVVVPLEFGDDLDCGPHLPDEVNDAKRYLAAEVAIEVLHDILRSECPDITEDKIRRLIMRYHREVNQKLDKVPMTIKEKPQKKSGVSI